jgi:hypothetical protein
MRANVGFQMSRGGGVLATVESLRDQREGIGRGFDPRPFARKRRGSAFDSDSGYGCRRGCFSGSGLASRSCKMGRRAWFGGRETGWVLRFLLSPGDAANRSQACEGAEEEAVTSHQGSLRTGYAEWIGGKKRADSREWGKWAKLVVNLGKQIELFGLPARGQPVIPLYAKYRPSSV